MTELYNRPMNFFEKLQVGWWWFGECLSEWCYTVVHPEDDGWDFFCHINLELTNETSIQRNLLSLDDVIELKRQIDSAITAYDEFMDLNSKLS